MPKQSPAVPNKKIASLRSARNDIKNRVFVQSLINKNPIVRSNVWHSNSSSSEIVNDKNDIIKIVKINVLVTRKLERPIDVVIENDDDGFISRSVDLPLYGYGGDVIESINNLKFEIELLYNDLMEDNDFSHEWLRYKKFLNEIVV